MISAIPATSAAPNAITVSRSKRVWFWQRWQNERRARKEAALEEKRRVWHACRDEEARLREIVMANVPSICYGQSTIRASIFDLLNKRADPTALGGVPSLQGRFIEDLIDQVLSAKFILDKGRNTHQDIDPRS